LLVLGLSPSSKTVESLENEILWNLRRSTVSQHFSVLHVYNEIKGTTMHKKIVAEIVSSIERRWVEIIEVKDVVSLLKYATYFNPKFIEKMEDVMVEMVALKEGFNQEEQTKVQIIHCLLVISINNFPYFFHS
jgi:hypothetical protein